MEGRPREVLATLQSLRADLPSGTLLVPGHGEPMPLGRIDYSIRYLEALLTRVESLVTGGSDLEAVVAGAELQEYSGYSMYPIVHRRINVPAAFAATTADGRRSLPER